ncbi:UDP-N-acetylmuramate dehydrogenase [Vibrio ulleungensis]|uniref:UDP-N-acetylenolpyruvoylglucosamine reductase n=1 Tax=Vibrio ulleungensis TaxID=2807619 RepID=A0ABS2HLE1_9VIBR|nr:UDP-N-acetylmuramate dehydrogenase [Vibrio ulleungensis]MBM7038308.1 UDP-N-acetylmuramate dehydrogenase [Vibrio ulleungensis]
MHESYSSSLKSLHTFHLDVHCAHIIEITSVDQIPKVFERLENRPHLILGRGSNVLFVEDFKGTVVLNRIGGIEIVEDSEFYHIHVGGGEDWPDFVSSMVDRGIGGFENLAMIPGCVGSSPIQNIGAYGVELDSLCTYVEYVDLQSAQTVRLPSSECGFGYRDSIFKHDIKDHVFITAVGFKVPKLWQPNLSYGALSESIDGDITIKSVFEAVCQTRKSKLPDPDEIGNAGSFFKNPVISKAQYSQLKDTFPNVVGFELEHGVKLAAGWLIDQAGLKGTLYGGAQVHPNQALVLTNPNQASPNDVVGLAHLVRRDVLEKFGVELQHEVRFIGALGETHLDALVSQL